MLPVSRYTKLYPSFFSIRFLNYEAPCIPRALEEGFRGQLPAYRGLPSGLEAAPVGSQVSVTRVS